MTPDQREPAVPGEPGTTPEVSPPGRLRRGWDRALGPLRTPRVEAVGRRLLQGLGVVAVVVGGTTVGTALAPPVTADVGPLTLDVRVVPSLQPGVQLLLPPAGQVRFDTHLAPVAVEAGVSEVDIDGTRALIDSPARLRALQSEAPDVLRTAMLQAGGLSAGLALVGTAGFALLVYRTQWRRIRQVAATSAALLTLTAVSAGLTFNSDSLAQPHFEGLLSRAPYVASQTAGLAQRLESYRSGLADIVQSVTTLYGTSNDLPVIPSRTGDDIVTVLHVSDLHLNPLGFDLTERLVRQFRADLVVDTGDITTWGTEVESALLSRIRDVRVPYVFVRGNHDSVRTQEAVQLNPNAVVLDGRVAEVGGLVFAGLGDPRFTPDGAVNLPSSRTPAGRTRAPGQPGDPVPSTSSRPSPEPAPSTAAAAVVPGEDPELVEGRRLARVVRDWNTAHPDRPVAVAAFHEPAGTPPLDGLVPLVLSGHLHHRSVKLYPAGTRLMVQGSTGGAGFGSLTRGRDELTRGRDEAVPLTASVLHFARSGERAGRLLAYDDVTVGGFGLASVLLERTVVREEPRAELELGKIRSGTACGPLGAGGRTECIAPEAPPSSRSIRSASSR